MQRKWDTILIYDGDADIETRYENATFKIFPEKLHANTLAWTNCTFNASI